MEPTQLQAKRPVPKEDTESDLEWKRAKLLDMFAARKRVRYLVPPKLFFEKHNNVLRVSIPSDLKKIKAHKL